MVICHCELINDRTIAEVAAGARLTADDVAERCGAGSQCGGCLDSIERLLAAADARRAPAA
jgi:bacterioferritin-associated ferredoxin